MSPSIKNLRRGVVTGGVALLVVLAVFLGIARLKGHHFHFDLPGRLGVDISQTANGFTYSQSQKGHTLFTIHASKLVQYKGDQAELHDVTITLYGPEGSGRSDKIYGADFKYDRKQGIARATGAVRIDFASPEVKPGSKADPAASAQASAQQSASTIHVTTSSLVFNQATGEASTDQRVDFVLPRATGSAIGAEYNAKSGVLVLDKQVALVTSVPAGQSATGPAGDTTIHAEHAQLLRETHQAYLIKDDATSQGKHTTSDQATITFRPDGSAQHIDAEGHVHVTTDDGSDVHASTAAIDLDALSHPVVANLAGGVTYHSSDGDRTMQGTAVSGTLAFAASPPLPPGPDKPKGAAQQQLKHAQFRDAVTFVLQQHSLNGDPNGSATREMSASKLDIDFGPGPDGKAEAQHVLGAGGATATLHDVPSKGPSKSTTISGDQLLATLANGRVFQVLDGKGNTKIVDSSSDGATSTSTGDTLHVTFLDPGVAKAPASSTAQVDTAVQTGNVTLLQVPAPAATSDKKPDAKGPSSSPSPLHATAQRAEYQAADQVLHLSGDPHLRNDTFALTADTVDYHRDTGDAAAIGKVKSTYTQQPGQKAPTLGGDGPVHVTADHAQLTGSTDVSVFYGTATQPARLWQGGDAVAAPVLELSRDDQTLDAHGARGDHGAVVHTTLGSKSANNAQPTAAKSPTGSAPVRMTSATLHYADQDRRADLRGSVTAEQPSGTVHADQVQIYLTPAGPSTTAPNTTGPNPTGPSTTGQLDHMVATGHVVITQPGRRGTGDKLVYTAADGRYVLTGSPGQPPRIVDAQKGTTTGAALLFKTADDSVEVSSHVDSGPGSAAPDPHARTVTDTHTPK
jgi:lipopolysaccharide export system protein LptA